MKTVAVVVVFVLLSGCATRPPKQPGCRGEFKPINKTARMTALAQNPGALLALCPANQNGGVHG